MSLLYIIPGQPYVKKSNQRVIHHQALKRQIKIDTPSYQLWHQDALKRLERYGFNPNFKEQKKFQPDLEAMINYPVNLQCRFFMKTNARVDLSALYEGIQDVLVEVGCLKDDNWHIVASHDGSGVEKDAERPRMEITITPKEATNGKAR